MGKTKVELGAIQETLLIPLLGRAVETRKRRGLINDPKAIEIVESLDYDFAKWKGQSALSGATLRTRMFDEYVREFLNQNPGGTVVEIGAGLNTRYERLDNGRATWIELDLPDSMALRRQFFQEEERRKMIAASFTDTDWYAEVKRAPAPYCFVSEAAIIYIEADLVRASFLNLREHFGNGATWVIMDTMSTRLVENQGKHSIMKTMSPDSWIRWKCDDPASLENWGLKLIDSKSFVDAPPEIRKDFPLFYKFMMTIAPGVIRRMADGYWLNRYQLAK